MSLSSSSTRASPGRYRPVLYIATGLAAAYAVLLIHRHFYPPYHTDLRRRNAIRRPSRRRGVPSEAGDSVDISTSIEAIRRLQQLISADESYGTFRVEVDTGRSYQCLLTPSEFPSREELQAILDVGQNQATLIRRMMEDSFLENFFAFEYPPSHVISRSTGEYQYLQHHLLDWGFTEPCILRAINMFNNDPNFGEVLRRRRSNGEATSLEITGNTVIDAYHQMPEPSADTQSLFSWRDGSDDTPPSREGQNLLNLLYHIAEDQARRDGYIHRGITCNHCGVVPIQGIRYRCVNCVDFDLCEACEAMQGHVKTHVFYKVRIPAPFLGSPRHSQPVLYPGRPMRLSRSLPRVIAKRLSRETKFENTELDALWEQFRCLASAEWQSDPNKFCLAIDRNTFDRCFLPNVASRPPGPNLIYDRIFSFYDTNGDNLIGFEEFVKGLASFGNKSTHERLKRAFNGYDIDGDGYVERKDFLRIFRAHYILTRETTRDLLTSIEEEYVDTGNRDIILGSQPISSAFSGLPPVGDPSRTGEGKRPNLHGDMEIVDNQGILQEEVEEELDRHVVIGDAAARNTFGRSRPTWLRLTPQIQQRDLFGSDGRDEGGDRNNDESSDFSIDFEEWPPPEDVQAEDIVQALGAYVPYEEVMDRVDRARIASCVAERFNREDREHIEHVRRTGIEERWRRRHFYIDEENGVTAPPGFHDENEDAVEDADETESHIPSPRSRSSSKVRFQDDITDNEYETRSNPSTSSRSIPMGERWGGIEIPEVERDVGKEVLFQVTQQGLNEILDILFKTKEDLIMEAYRTRAERKRWAKEIEDFADAHYRPPRADGKERDLGLSVEDIGPETDDIPPADKPLQQLLNEAGYSLVSEPDNDQETSDPLEIAETSSHSPVPDRDNEQVVSDLPENDHVPSASENMAFEVEEEDDESHVGHAFLQDSEDTPALDEALQISEATNFNTLANRSIAHADSPVYESAPTSTAASASSSSQSNQALHHSNASLPLRLRFQQPRHRRRSSHTSQIANPSCSSTISSDPAKHHIPPPSPPIPPSPKTLARWYRLSQVEKEAKERGGTGAKLNFEEFAQQMQGERGKSLLFLTSWLDMISF
ncbi:EF hand domain-containing protein [Coccidioides immitis RS]|uniref:EF hand domain-containing protein n=2 Tax=Coccidioides immitis TaxID=5501 RepID=J3K4M1_COCIM|nr:EF hand domain-containing protein [Coccidioides immitis RS]EAS29272.3 EF hand domain-containing protein [Coccidioides immitis RS]KMP06404.1 EF hand domain containing protein [Coccidioides immitis RMSCC 2394]TPX22616.1 hypothetical protein DIZ76_014493 [Coccidioides immitis]